jgi:hypothetical protein
MSVFDRLEMPDAFAGAGVERDHRVGEEIVAVPVAAVKIEGGRAGRYEDQSALDIDRRAAPRIRATAVVPGILRPGLVAEFSGPGHGVEAP